MLPINNGSNTPCANISSNCVIWQGPDIPCINICNGDTVSDVVAALGQELCDLIDSVSEINIDLTSLDLGTIPPPSGGGGGTGDYLQVIIDYINNLPVTPTTATPTIINIPPCLQYNDPQGNVITSLPIEDFVVYLANKICNIISDITLINNTIADIINRVVILENCVLPCDPGTGGGDPIINSTCIMQGSSVTASTLLAALEVDYCNFVNAVGSVTQINNAVNSTCVYGATQMLSINSNYGTQPNWISNPTTLSEINQNQWVVICDLYNAVLNIQQNCCDTDCAGVNFGATSTVIYDPVTGLASGINFNFTSTSIPNGFTDCGSTITLTDSSGSSTNTPVNVVGLSTQPAGTLINLNGINNQGSVNAQIQMCVTDGTNTCSENQNSSISLNTPCPLTRIASISDPTQITVQWNTQVLLGAITYDWALTDVNTPTTPAFTGTIVVPAVNPPSISSFTVSGIVPGITYDITITVIDTATGNILTSCYIGSYTNQNVTDTCNNKVNLNPSVLNNNYVASTDKLLYGAQKSIQTSDIFDKQYYYNITTNENEYYIIDRLVNNPSLSFNSYSSSILNLNAYSIYYDPNNPATLEVEISQDMVNWSSFNTYTVPQSGLLTLSFPIATTPTVLYIRAKVVNSTGKTNWTVSKYDSLTNYFIILNNINTGLIPVASLPSSYVDGIAVSSAGSLDNVTFDCDNELNNTVKDGILNSGTWYYSGKMYYNNDYHYIYHYLYQGLDNYKTVACCKCPAHIFKHNIPLSQTNISPGGTTEITIPYYLGSGNAAFTIISQPAYGTLTQQGSSNAFVYQNTVLNDQNGQPIIGDSFTIELGPSVSGDCNSVQVTISIEMNTVSPKGTVNTADNIFAFVNTNSFNSTNEPEKITAVINNLKTTLQNTCPNWTGELYIIPTTSDRWLSYPKAVLDKTIALNEDPSWVNVRRLPTDWEGGAAVDNTRAYVIAFSNNSSISYHGSNLTSAWLGQPTAEYLQDYEEYTDILNGTELSSWAKTKNFNGASPFADGVQLVYYPITHDTNGVSAAAILQGLGSYAGDMIEPKSYVIETAVDVSGYLMKGLVPSATNPYKDAVTINGLEVKGLFTQNVKMFLNQSVNGLTRTEYLDELIADDNTGDFKYKMISMFLDENNTCSGTNLLMFEWKYCTGEWNKELDSLNFPANASDGDVYRTESGSCITLRTSTGTATGTNVLPFDILNSTLKTSCECCVNEDVARFVYLCDDPTTTSTILDECAVLSTGDVISMDDGTGTIRCWTVSEIITDPADIKPFTKYGDCTQCAASIS